MPPFPKLVNLDEVRGGRGARGVKGASLFTVANSPVGVWFIQENLSLHFDV